MSSTDLLKSVDWWKSLRGKYVKGHWYETYLCSQEEFKGFWDSVEGREEIVRLKVGFMCSHGIDQSYDGVGKYFGRDSLFYYEDREKLGQRGFGLVGGEVETSGRKEIRIMFIDWVLGELDNSKKVLE